MKPGNRIRRNRRARLSGRPPAQARRGSAMLFCLMVILVLTIAGMGMATAMAQSLHLVRRQKYSSLAFNIAESGAEAALLWLRRQPTPPGDAAAFNPFGGSVALGSGSYYAIIDPADTNGSGDLKRYIVRCQGSALNRQETVELYVQLANFGRYAYFTDYERSSVTNGAIYFKGGEVIDGPAHSNNSESSIFNINYVGSTASIFKDKLTSVESNINYVPGDPQSEADYQLIYEEGSRGFQLGVNRIELPDSTDKQKIAAWGSNAGYPSTDGIYVPAAGSSATAGIYIRGDASLNFSVTAEGWQRISAVQAGVTTTITVKRDTNQTLVQRGSNTTTYVGTTNGVIYSTGNITGLSGELADSRMNGSQLVNRNAFTLATDMVAGKGVTLTNNLTYRTAPNSSLPWDDPLNLRSACLGIVARNVTVASGAPQNLTLHGVLLAGGRNTADGSFSVSNWSSKSPTGVLNLVGGVIQKKRGPVGTFNGSTGEQVSGYSKNYHYDRRMAINPPPFFPTTGNYERLSWRRISAG